MARTRDQARFEARRDEILQAAAGCFVRRGFHQTGMQEICAAAGMSPGALYRYFDSKDAIIEAIAEAEREENAALLAALAESRDPVAGLQAVVEAVLLAYADPDAGRLAVEVLAEAARNPRVAEGFARNLAEMKAGVVAALEAGQTEAVIDPGLATGPAAEVLIALMDGLCARSILDPAHDPQTLLPTLRTLIRRFLEVPG
ncbi:MAG: TetR/AcrR family transcriptional regulator [Kiloniellales bacterium]|nr:TetR/AcrR family transcriptional regulator [Kiloniellales bacterium]